MKKQDILGSRVSTVFLSLGSNLGNRCLNIEKAKFLLATNKITITKCSNYYETNSWPNNNFPKFLNIILKIKTKLDPFSLLMIIKDIEKKLGRKNKPKNYPRKCDIDIIDYDSRCFSLNFNNTKLRIPHPRLHNRNFVLVPLFEISKNWKHPKFKLNISKLITNISAADLRNIKLI